MLRCVAYTASYQAPDAIFSGTSLVPLIYGALHVVAAQHPALSCGIIDEDHPDPAFICLDEIDLQHCVVFKHVSEQLSSPSQRTKILEEILAHEHSLLWPHLSTRPTWKLLVVPYLAGNYGSTRPLIDISFIFHHALFDGLSGPAFHRSFLNALNRPEAYESTDPIIHVSKSVELPPPVEDKLCLRVTYRHLLWELFATYLPALARPFASSTNTPWTGYPASLPTTSSYVSHVRIIDVPADRLHTILTQCKQEHSTFTAALHGIIVQCLSQLVPDAPAFVGSTPYSVRSFTGTAADEMVNQVSVIATTYPRDLIESVQKKSGTGLPDRADIYVIGRQLLQDLQTSKSAFPVDNILSLLQYLSDYHAYFRKQLGRPRGATFEVSNLGVFRPSPSPPAEDNAAEDEGHGWNIERVLFTQGGSVVGNALSFNCASVEGGPLTVSLTWQEGAVETILAERLLQLVEETLMSLGYDDM